MKHVTLSGFSDEIAPKLDDQLSAVQSFGLKYIELRAADGVNVSAFTPEKLKEVREKLSKAGVAVSSVGSPLGKTSIVDPLGPELDRLKRTVEIAQTLNAPYIRLFSFYLPKGDDPEGYRDEVLLRLSRFREAAAGSGVTLLHENEKGIYGDTAPRCRTLMEALSGPDFAAVFDFANFVEVGQETLPAYALLKPYIRYVHIKDAVWDTKQIVPAGSGDGHLPEILGDLIRGGYEGFLSLEPHLVDFAGLKALEQDPKKRESALSPRDAWKLALDALRGVLEAIEKEEA